MLAQVIEASACLCSSLLEELPLLEQSWLVRKCGFGIKNLYA
jgi:hypothetical protein